MRRPTILSTLILLALGACGKKSQPVEPASTTQGTRLNLNATAMSPEVHINPLDGGATSIQIGAAHAQLPGENAHGAPSEPEPEAH